MKEKVNQKGFIQIPLLVIVISAIIIASVGAGVVLRKQGKLTDITANISEALKGAEGPVIIDSERKTESQESQIEEEQEMVQNSNKEKKVIREAPIEEKIIKKPVGEEIGGIEEKPTIEKEEKIVEEVEVLEPTPKPTPEPMVKTDRDKMIEIFKAEALKKWGDDYSMVKYEIEKQTAAYDWVIKYVKYPDILKRAKQKWGNDYAMIKYEYEKQTEAYEWINQQTAYPEIMTKAKQKWGDDYVMVKYEYEKQVKAYEALGL